MKDYPNSYDGCESLGGTYTYDTFNKGYPDSEIHTSVCRMYGPGWDGMTKEYVDAHCTEDLGEPQLMRSNREICMQALSHESKCYFEGGDEVSDQSGCPTVSGAFNVQYESGGRCELTATGYYNYWNSDITQTSVYKVAEMCNTLGEAESKWKLSVGKIWKPGQFDTKEKCEVGACNMGYHYTEEQCGQIERCSRWACDGCEKDWTSSNNGKFVADNVCVYKNTGSDVSDEVSCHNKFGADMAEWNAELGICVANANKGEWQCDALEDTAYYECREMQADTCAGAGYDDAPSIAKTLLNCRKTPSAECKTRESCESSGECRNGLRRRYWFDGEQHYMDNVCVAPTKDEHGRSSCAEFMDQSQPNYWEGVEQLQDNTCVLMKKTEVSGGGGGGGGGESRAVMNPNTSPPLRASAPSLKAQSGLLLWRLVRLAWTRRSARLATGCSTTLTLPSARSATRTSNTWGNGTGTSGRSAACPTRSIGWTGNGTRRTSGFPRWTPGASST